MVARPWRPGMSWPRSASLMTNRQDIHPPAEFRIRAGGQLYLHRRGVRKLRRKRYGAYDSRGRLAGKRPITARPAGTEHRSRFGHWEGNTMLGAGQAGPAASTTTPTPLPGPPASRPSVNHVPGRSVNYLPGCSAGGHESPTTAATANLSHPGNADTRRRTSRPAALPRAE